MSKAEINIQICKKIEIKKEKLQEILIANHFAKNTSHNVKFEDEVVYDFSPTKFVYSMMVFNMIYDIFEVHSNDTVKDKLSNLMHWMFEREPEISSKLNLEISDSNIEDLDKIIVDRTVTNSKKNKLLDRIKKIKNKTPLSETELLDILVFLNDIRNNFFHGTKKAQMAIEKGQYRRLEIYSDFLLAFHNVFFDIVEKEEMNLHRDSLDDDLKENIGLLKR